MVLLARGENPGKDAFKDEPRVTFAKASLAQAPEMVRAVKGCEAVYHLAGINREKGEQSYLAVHLEGTRNLMSVMRQAHINRIIHVSFLRAHSKHECPYHVSKAGSEETVRGSGFNWTIFRPGAIYGEGDQFLRSLQKTLKTMPAFGLVGHEPKPMAPLHIDDFSRILAASLTREDTYSKHYAVVGPEILTLSDVVDRVGEDVKVKPNKLPLPVAFHRVAAMGMEMFMKEPLLTNAQVTMLNENMVEPYLSCDPLPPEFTPQIPFLRSKETAKVERDIQAIARNRGVELSDSDIDV